MNELITFLTKLAREQELRPDLFDALLTGRHARYAYHRLRFLVPRLVLRLALHTLEVWFFAQVLPWEYFAPLLSFRAASAIVGASYWGVLEGLRSRVRTELAQRHRERGQRVVEAWLGAAALLSLSCVLGITAWVAWGSPEAHEPGITLSEAYGFACFVGLALELVPRTYHAGIFAVQRVYRPFFTFVLPDVLELVCVIVAWNRFGPWGIPLSILAMGAVRAVLSWHYARRAYRRSRMAPPRMARIPQAMRSLSRKDAKNACLHALSNASSQLDAMLIFALAQAERGPQEGITLAVLYYAMRPVMGAANSWTRAFYFDWKRLEGGVGRVLQPAFHRMLTRVGLVIAGAVGTVLVGLVLFLDRAHISSSVFLLLPLFAARSSFAVEQLQAFSLGQHRPLVGITGVLLAVLGLVTLSPLSEGSLLGAVILVLLLAVAWLRVQRRALWQTHAPLGTGPAGWMARLSSAPHAVRIGMATVDRRVATPQRVLLALLAHLPGAQIARLGRAHLAWFTDANVSQGREPWHVLAWTGGALLQLSLVEAPNGAQAAEELRRREPFLLALSREAGPRLGSEELAATFRREQREGYVLDFTRGTGSVGAGAMPWAARRALLRALVKGTRSGLRSEAPEAGYQVVVLAPSGVPHMAFVAPKGAAGFRAFARRVEAANLLYLQ